MTDWGPFDLSGKNAVVTGGAMGIGYGIVVRFVEAGAKVVVADLDGEAAARVAKQMGGPRQAVSMAVDVGADDAGEAIVSTCVDAFTSIGCFRPHPSCSTASTGSTCEDWRLPPRRRRPG